MDGSTSHLENLSVSPGPFHNGHPDSKSLQSRNEDTTRLPVQVDLQNQEDLVNATHSEDRHHADRKKDGNASNQPGNPAALGGPAHMSYDNGSKELSKVSSELVPIINRRFLSTKDIATGEVSQASKDSTISVQIEVNKSLAYKITLPTRQESDILVKRMADGQQGNTDNSGESRLVQTLAQRTYQQIASKFTCFGRLPTELRRQIWVIALHAEEVFIVKAVRDFKAIHGLRGQSVLFTHVTLEFYDPPQKVNILRVSKEAATEARMLLCTETPAAPKRNIKSDIAYIPHLKTWQRYKSYARERSFQQNMRFPRVAFDFQDWLDLTPQEFHHDLMDWEDFDSVDEIIFVVSSAIWTADYKPVHFIEPSMPPAYHRTLKYGEIGLKNGEAIWFDEEEEAFVPHEASIAFQWEWLAKNVVRAIEKMRDKHNAVHKRFNETKQAAAAAGVKMKWSGNVCYDKLPCPFTKVPRVSFRESIPKH